MTGGEAHAPRHALRRAVALILGVAFGLAAIGIVWVLSIGRGHEAANAAVDDGSITCATDGSPPSAITVDSTAQGVPLRVWSDGAGLVFFAVGEEQAPFDTFTIELVPGSNDFALPVPPGALRFGCFATPFDAGAVDEQLLRSITVSDPHSSWAPTSLSCADPRFWTVSESPWDSYLSGEEAKTGRSLEEVASRELPWLRPTDDVVAAMYPESEWVESVLVMREGQGVALISRLTNPDSASSSQIAQIRFSVCGSVEEVGPTG